MTDPAENAMQTGRRWGGGILKLSGTVFKYASMGTMAIIVLGLIAEPATAQGVTSVFGNGVDLLTESAQKVGEAAGIGSGAEAGGPSDPSSASAPSAPEESVPNETVSGDASADYNM